MEFVHIKTEIIVFTRLSDLIPVDFLSVASPDLGQWGRGGRGARGGQNNDIIITIGREVLSAYQAILLGINGVSVLLHHPSSL